MKSAWQSKDHSLMKRSRDSTPGGDYDRIAIVPFVGVYYVSRIAETTI